MGMIKSYNKRGGNKQMIKIIKSLFERKDWMVETYKKQERAYIQSVRLKQLKGVVR